MSVADLQAELAERGCVLWVEGEMLRFRAPDGALTPPLMARLKREKKALIAALRSDSRSGGRSVHTQQPSFGQQAMWLMHRSAPRSAAYNVASAIRITSPVDFEALQRVWRTLITRHDSLRTTFETTAGRLIARVHDEPAVDVERVCVAGESEQAVRQQLEVDYRRPFDLTQGPLARLRLYTSAPDRHVLLMAMHHIVLDAWSLWVLHDELGTLYRQEASGQVGVLPAVETRYGDFVRWQQELPNTEHGRKQWDAWREKLANDPAPAALSWDRPRPVRNEQRGASLHFRLPADLAAELREVGRRNGATPFVTLLSVFQTLIHRQSGQTDFLVGTTTSGRSAKQFNRTVGYLVNTLPLRATIADGATFADLLEQSRETVLQGMAAQDFPFPLIVERLNPPREAGALPLCRVMFGLQKPHDFGEAMQALDDADRSIDWGGLQAAAYKLDQQEGQFDLTLEMYETTSTFLGIVKYDPALLDRESVELLAERYEHVARQVVADPDLALDDINLLTPTDQKRLAAWPAESPSPSETSRQPERIEHVLATQAKQRPDAVALQDASRRLTYRQLDEQTNQIAAWLRDHGAVEGRPVGCCLTRGVDAWLAQVACLKAGATYVPLDETGPASRVAGLLRDCEATLLLADTPTAKRLDLATVELPCRLELLDESAVEISGHTTDALPVSGGTGSDAYIIYTSGSTGDPKGVVVSHAAFLEHLCRVQSTYGVTAEDRVLQFSAMTFDPSLEQAWTAWSAGASLVVRGPRLWSASEFWRVIADNAVTVANLPPAYFRECSEALPRGEADAAETLRLMVVGGDAFPTQSLAAWRGRPTRVLNAYGPTEAVVTATIADTRGWAEGAGRPSIGKPLPGTEAFVVDTRGRRQPIGVAGELLLSGAALASRYLGDQELTSRRFEPLPELTGDDRPVYRTGDVVRWKNNGELEFLGRIDRQVKVNGYRIELGEIERAMTSVAGVREAVAVVDEKGGEQGGGATRLVAYYAAADGASVTPQDISAALRSRLPHYMAPAAFAELEALPRNASGKVATAKLPAIAEQAPASTREYAPPKTDLQRVLTEAWSEVLGVDRVGIHDDFFELGGASLKSLQIVSAAEARGLRLDGDALSPALLFEYPTIAQLAEQLAKQLEDCCLGAEPSVATVG